MKNNDPEFWTILKSLPKTLEEELADALAAAIQKEIDDEIVATLVAEATKSSRETPWYHRSRAGKKWQ